MKKSNKTLAVLSLSLLALPIVGCHHNEAGLTPDGEKVTVDEAIPFVMNGIAKQFSNLETSNPEKKGKRRDGYTGWQVSSTVKHFSITDDSVIKYDKTEKREAYETTQHFDVGLENLHAILKLSNIEGKAEYQNPKEDLKQRAEKVLGSFELGIDKLFMNYQKQDPTAEKEKDKKTTYGFETPSTKFSMYLKENKLYVDPTSTGLRLLLTNFANAAMSYGIDLDKGVTPFLPIIFGTYNESTDSFDGGLLGKKYKFEVDKLSESIVSFSDGATQFEVELAKEKAIGNILAMPGYLEVANDETIIELTNQLYDELYQTTVTYQQIPEIYAKYEALIAERIKEIEKPVEVETPKEYESLATDEAVQKVKEYFKWIEAYKLQDGTYSLYINLNSETVAPIFDEYKTYVVETLNARVEKGAITEETKNNIINAYEKVEKALSVNRFEFVVNVGEYGLNYIKSAADIGINIELPFYKVDVKLGEKHKIEPEFIKAGSIKDTSSLKFEYEFKIEDLTSGVEIPDLSDYEKFGIGLL